MVNSFDRASSQFIAKSQDAFQDAQVKSGLIFIKANYAKLPDAIENLESRGLSLVESTKIYNNAKLSIENVTGLMGQKVNTKLKAVINKNPGLEKIMEAAKIHEGMAGNLELNITQTAALKYAPVTSCEVERSFSRYKDIVSNKRQSLSPENIEKHLITAWEANINDV